MALDKDRLALAIKDALKTLNSEITGAEETKVLNAWKLICEEIIKEFQDNGDIDLAADDILVNPGTFKDSVPLPVTGQGKSVAVTLTQRIK